MKKESKVIKRNYGIDLLRIISMFMIVILHCLGRGGILSNSIVNSSQYKITWMLEIICFCAVDIFALISGYVSYREEESKVKYSNYINIWFQVVFYGLLITIIFDIFNISDISISNYIISFFPVSTGAYWYFTAYSALFVLMPLINKAIRNIDNSLLKKIFIMIIIVFSIYDTIVNRFELNNGYSFIWILLLYVLGAIIKKCDILKEIKNYKAILAIIFFYLITYFYKIYGFEFNLYNVEITKNLFVNYTSITILGVSILFLVLLSRIKYSSFIKRIISFFAVSSFSIYLINCNPLIWNDVINGMFVSITNNSRFKVILYVFIFSIVFCIFSVLIDKIRIFIFNKLKINELSKKIEVLMSNLIERILKIL